MFAMHWRGTGTPAPVIGRATFCRCTLTRFVQYFARLSSVDGGGFHQVLDHMY